MKRPAAAPETSFQGMSFGLVAAVTGDDAKQMTQVAGMLLLRFHPSQVVHLLLQEFLAPRLFAVVADQVKVLQTLRRHSIRT